MSPSSLHQIARDIFDHALVAVDPARAVQRATSIDGSRLKVCESVIEIGTRALYAIAIGKAASSMATGLNLVLGDRIAAGVLSGPTTHSFNSNRWQTFRGGHPTPNEQSLAAAQAAFALLDRANKEQAIVFALVSGGGSAMLEWPASDDISLDDLRRANHLLVNCGASINEINVVRRAFSTVKGGGLARRTPDATLITLIVSDTNEGDEASVASGPTLEPPTSDRSAIEVVRQYQLESALPNSILKAITDNRTNPELKQNPVFVLLDNRTALQAAATKAQAHGFNAVIADEICEQPIAKGCSQLISRFNEMPGRTCLISGGEFSCPVRGNGYGGRNLETVLRCVQLITSRKDVSGKQQGTIILSAGTDGIDGNSPAAGAIADETTIVRAEELGLDADEFLARSDSFSFFEKLQDAIITGPTGTNVRDIRIIMNE